MYRIKLKGKKLEFAVYRPYVPLLADCFLQSYQNPKKFQKFYHVQFFARVAAVRAGFYYGYEARDFGQVLFAKEPAAFGVPAVSKTKRTPGNTLAAFQRIYIFGDKLLQSSWKIGKTDFTKYSEKQLLSVFKKFFDDYITFSTALMGFNIQYIVEEKIRALFANDPAQDEKVAILTFPDRQNISACEIADLLRLRLKFDARRIDRWEKVGVIEHRLLKKHVQKYGWINARGAMGQAWTEKDIFERARSEKNCAVRLHELEQSGVSHKKQAVQLLSEVKADKNIKYLVQVAKELVYFRTYRTDYLNWVFFNIRPLMVAIANKRGVNYEDIIHYLVKEILSGKKIATKEIARRKQGYALMLIKPNELWFSSDSKKIEFWKKKYTEEEAGDVKEVAGAAAFKGLIRGNVRVIKSKEDMLKFKVGEILVTSMTTPNMVQIMQKAVAFVTDEGGITCHAAIVAREMKKPCVIGTKIATKVFKDGDLIEVDANKGVVKKL